MQRKIYYLFISSTSFCKLGFLFLKKSPNFPCVYIMHLHVLQEVHLIFFYYYYLSHLFMLVLNWKRGCKSTPPVGVQVLLFFHLFPYPWFPCEAHRNTARHQRAASGLRWNAKHWVNPVFMLTVSFDKVLSELTYGNFIMMCLHTVISSAFHPHFLGLTIVPIMSVIVNSFM